MSQLMFASLQIFRVALISLVACPEYALLLACGKPNDIHIHIFLDKTLHMVKITIALFRAYLPGTSSG